MIPSIANLPTRYEPLVQTFGEHARTTFLEQPDDLHFINMLIKRIKSSKQSKIVFIYADSGSGKTTFIHSLELFLRDEIDYVERLPSDTELSLDEIPQYLRKIEKSHSIKVINFDGRENLYFDQAQYQTFFGRLNTILRERDDFLIVWPVNHIEFSEKMVELLSIVGGKSPFGSKPIYSLVGIEKLKYVIILNKIMQIANWQYADAAIDQNEIEEIAQKAIKIGSFLDEVQELIVSRFEDEKFQIKFPTIVFTMASGSYEIRDICRNMRRADSFYLEASRLMMYTKQSNIADWWIQRNKNRITSLPFVISLFNAQLASLSGSSVVNSVASQGAQSIKSGMPRGKANTGSAKVVIRSSELYKYSIGSSADVVQGASAVKQGTIDAYNYLQKLSKTHHKELNIAVMSLLKIADGGFSNMRYEVPDGSGLIVDVVCDRDYDAELVNIEFHYKSIDETSNNKIAIYILEKLKEYAINYNICTP